MKGRAFSLFELIVTVCAILILIGVFAICANTTLKAARETALQAELMNLRMSLEHYRIIYDQFPDDLSSLAKERLTDKPYGTIMASITFLKHFRVDKQGYLLDPFFNRYGYDKDNGAVYSLTRGYERW